MTKASKASAFLENMNMTQEPVEVKPPMAREKTIEKKAAGRVVPKTRDGLKHLGGYCAPDTVEKFAILRARLKLDNSECITLAIQELYSKQKAKKAFND
jgi:hypothetical protein